MAISDIFKNKNEVKKPTVKRKKVLAVKNEEIKVVAPVKNTVRNNDGKFSYEAIKQPHISEKATYLADGNKYTFEVLPNYNKHEIKGAVEGVYGVKVLSVNIIKIPAKKRRLGKTQGFRKAFKKAIVTIKEGQKIEIL